MDARQGWSDNGHVVIDWSRVARGQIVDHVNVKAKACPVHFGPPQWNVLVVVPNSEPATVDRLLDASIRTYWPKIHKWVPTKELLANGHKKMAKVPRSMFPGYVFVDRRSGLDDFRTPLGVKGVRDYLWREAIDQYGRLTREPCTIPNGIYAAMQERECEKSQLADKEKRKPFKVGESVRIKEGPFRDFVARVEQADDRGRVAILMDIFARPTPAMMNVAQLELA